MKPAPPLEWHPYYAGKTWLMDWLNEPGRWDVRVASDVPADTSINVLTLTKRKAWGPAPYVGPPFVYLWYVGVDNLGRQIAGESRIVYTDPMDRPTT